MYSLEGIMIKQRKKSRYHQVLFSDELPFKGRKEAKKNAYKRREKHSKSLSEQVSYS